MAAITAGTSGIEAAFARQHSVKVLSAMCATWRRIPTLGTAGGRAPIRLGPTRRGTRGAVGWHHRGMESDVRVCPFCGDPPGVGMFCGVCGRNLVAVERLPTHAEWEVDRPASAAGTEDRGPVAERCAEATAAFLAAMHAAGDPGASKIAMSGGSGFRRARQTYGWVVRPVHREDDDDPSRYEPGLVVTTEGRFHRQDSEVRGWGQRDFPRYHDTVDPDPIDMPVEERLIDELAAVLRENGVASDPPPTIP
jgi:hypothetical protein